MHVNFGVISQDLSFEMGSLTGLGFTGQSRLADQRSPKQLPILASPVVGLRVCTTVPCLFNTESRDHTQISMKPFTSDLSPGSLCTFLVVSFEAQ